MSCFHSALPPPFPVCKLSLSFSVCFFSLLTCPSVKGILFSETTACLLTNYSTIYQILFKLLLSPHNIKYWLVSFRELRIDKRHRMSATIPSVVQTQDTKTNPLQKPQLCWSHSVKKNFSLVINCWNNVHTHNSICFMVQGSIHTRYLFGTCWQ